MTDEIDNLLDYLKKAGLNTINTNSPAWKILHNTKEVSSIDKTREGVNSIQHKIKK